MFSPFLAIAPWIRINLPPCHIDVPYSTEEFSSLSLDGAYDFKANKKLGSGASGSVFLATHKMTQNRVAVKRFLCNYNSVKDFRRELASLRVLRGHPNIVNLIDSFGGKRPALVMEVANHGDLESYLEDHGPLTEDAAKYIMLQLLNAIQACHDKNIMHRDIKLGNVLVSAIDGVRLTVQLADFGFSAKSKHRLQRYCGTKGYMAPEIRANKFYDHSIDIWSLGITMHALLTGKVPSNGKLTIDRLSPMLQKYPNKRLTAKQLLGHFWFMDHSTLTQFVKRLIDGINGYYDEICGLCGTYKIHCEVFVEKKP
ncbi:hypothetical protein THRCLA_04158 [Thraustotheca clavata]|uniref:Protein kinase domain-containing protein n=1 Tax=Thraustotheca clavata TaxID=74557 RepID=A0A1V9ZZT8_9STRA|nr:hypothetical protein THRCLA_04158 [Thraustotheca clavata]